MCGLAYYFLLAVSIFPAYSKLVNHFSRREKEIVWNMNSEMETWMFFRKCCRYFTTFKCCGREIPWLKGAIKFTLKHTSLAFMRPWVQLSCPATTDTKKH